MPYFDEPVGWVKIQTTSKTTQRYYATKRLIIHLPNTPNCYVRVGEFRGYLFTRNAWQKYAKRNGFGAGNQANWLVNGSTTRETGFCGFDHAITGAIYLTFHNGEKSSLDRPNYTSIQVFYFKISVKKKRRKQIRFEKQNFFFRNFNPIRGLCVGRKPVKPVLWSTDTAWYLYSFWALFAFQKVQLDNKTPCAALSMT